VRTPFGEFARAALAQLGFGRRVSVIAKSEGLSVKISEGWGPTAPTLLVSNAGAPNGLVARLRCALPGAPTPERNEQPRPKRAGRVQDRAIVKPVP
jgi:hypothetical protein